MTDAENRSICIKSAAVKCSEWTYEHNFLNYSFSPDGRFVFKWTFVSFLVVDVFYGASRKFVLDTTTKNLRIRDFLPLSGSSGLLLYSQDGKTFISVLSFNFYGNNTYELAHPKEIMEDCKEYGGNITRNEDDSNKGVIFLTRNCPGDVFIFFTLADSHQIHFELSVETENREYCQFGYYTHDCFYYFRIAYGLGQRPFEALKLLEQRKNAETQNVFFGPLPLMNRRNLMHRTQMPRFHGCWSNGVFYLSVNIDPNQYFITLNLQTLKWTNLDFEFINFREPRIQITSHRILIVHDESKANGSPNRVVSTYRIPLEQPESLQMLSFFQIRRNHDFQPHNLRLLLNSLLQPIWTN